MLFRGLEGFTRCLACRYVWEAGIDLCPHCQGRCLPVEVCRSCGQDFWRGMTHVDIDPLDDPLSKQFQMAYRLQKGSPHSYEIFPDLSRDSSSRTLRLTTELRKDAKVLDESEEDADDTDVEDEAAEQKPDTPNSAKKAARSNNTTTIATKKPRGKAREMRGISVCGHCGHATLQEPADHQCATCGNMVTRFLYQADRIIQCPACRGRYGSREIVTAFGTSVAASVAVLTSAVMRRLSEQERRLLIFSDNRQDTAFQAGYLQDKHGQFTKRQLIYQVVKEETDLGHAAVGLVDLPEMVFSRGVRLRLFEAPKRKREREEGIMLIVSPKMGQ